MTFDSPLVLPLDLDTDLRFTITSGGTTCVRFEETETTLDLTVLGQTYRERPSGGLGLAVTCPDGTSYSNGNVFELLDCAADGGVLELPGTSWSTGDDYLTFYFISVSNDTSSSLPAFDCRRAIASSASSPAPTTPGARRMFTRRTGGPRR